MLRFVRTNTFSGYNWQYLWRISFRINSWSNALQLAFFVSTAK